jgi:hypothetical protein
MKNFKEMSNVELLTSFNSGQGKTMEIPSFASLENGTLKYGQLTANVSPAWQEAYILMQLHSGLKDRNPDQQGKLFAAYNEGRLSLNHTSESKPTKTLDNHYLSSEDYLNNVIHLSGNKNTVNAILELVESVLSDSKATKEQLLATLTDVKNTILPVDKLQVYETLKAKEERFETIADEFIELDNTVINILSDNSFKISIKPAITSMDNAVKLAAENGFSVEKVDFNPTTMTMVIVFKA